MFSYLRKFVSVLVFLVFFGTSALSSVTSVFANDYITSLFLYLDDGGPITTTQNLRFSLWSDGRLDSGDISGGGAINGAAPMYAGYQTVLTRTPDAHGRLKLAFAELPGLPYVTADNQFLMVEYKDDGDPDTSYVLYSNTYLGSAMDRFPLLVGGPDIFQGIYTNNATTANTFTLDRDDTGGDVVLQFGQTLNESLRWDDTQNYFFFSDDLVVDGNLNIQGNTFRLDSDNSGAGADVDIVANQGSDPDGVLRYNSTLNRWEISNDGGPFTAISTGVGGADDFESVYSADADKVLNTADGAFTINTGTNDFIVDSNDWNVNATGDLEAASLTSNGSLTVSGTTNLNGEVNVGDGGDAVNINSNTWDVSSAGVASGFTGITSTGTVNYSGSSAFRIREDSNPATNAACGTIGEVILDTTDNELQVCTVTGVAGAATWIAVRAGDATTLDGIDSVSFLRSDTSDTFTSGTLTFDNGTTLTLNGVVNIGDGGDAVEVNSDTWDVSAAGVASGFTGITSTGTVDYSGTSAFRIREDANPTLNSACATVGELILDTTDNEIQVCTATGVAGAATWVALKAGDASTLDGLDSTQFLRSDTSDTFTSGTLLFDDGTTFEVRGTAIIGDGGDSVSINSSTWGVTSGGVASGLTGLTSSGTVNFSGTDGLRIRESANPSTSAACTTANEVIMNTTLNRIEVCTVPGVAGAATWVVAPAGDASSFDGLTSGEFLRSNTSDNYTSGTMTFDAGTTLTTEGTLNVNGAANIGDGGGSVEIDSSTWGVTSGGVASGLTGLTTTGTVNFSGTDAQRIRESANPTTSAACTTANEVIMNTTLNRIEVCTAPGTAGAATWVVAPAGDASSFDGLTSGQFLRSDASDTYTSGTLTLDNGTTLNVNGVANIGDGGDTVEIDSSTWGVSSAGVASGFTGFTSTGSIDTSGASAQRIRESANPTTSAACTTANELIMNTTLNRIEVCTVPGVAGAATWVVAPAGDASSFDGLTSGEFLRSNSSDTYTSGTLTLDNGTTLNVNGVANIGDGGDSVEIDSNTWGVTSGGVASGLTGITTTGTVNFSGTDAQRIRESANPTTSAACTTANELIMNTTLDRIEICTVPGVAGAATWIVAPAGDADSLDGLTSGQFLRSDASDAYTSGTMTYNAGTTLQVDGTLTVNGAATIGDGGDTVSINSSDWDISATGDMSGIGSITADGLITGTAGASLSGGILNFNVSSNFATNINTGTSTGTVSIGGGLNSVAINSDTWDVDASGAASGFTSFDASGNITTSGGDFIIGTTGLTETTSATDSGAYLIGAFDEFDNSNSTNVQAILNDFDALIGANAPNVEALYFHPEYPNAVIFRDGTNNQGTLVSDRDNTNNRSYYQWTSNNATTQDIDVRVRFVLPDDFVTVGDFTFEYQTGTATTADNRIDVTFINVTDSNTTCATSTNNANTSWTSGTIAAASIIAGCTGGTALGAGDVVEIVLKLHDNSGAADFSRIGFIRLLYSN